MKPANISLTDRVPPSLRSTIQTTLGAWRDATRDVSAGRSLADLRRKVEAVFGGNPNMYGEKGAARTVERAARVLGDQFLSCSNGARGKRESSWTICAYTIEPGSLNLHNISVSGWAGYGCAWRIDEVGGITRHAAARYIERAPGNNITFIELVEATMDVLLRGAVARRRQGVVVPQLPIPTRDGTMVAVADATKRVLEVITYINASTLSPRRARWLEEFKEYNAAAEVAGPNFFTEAQLLDEGARLWAETRECGLRRAA
jgi:hypothetical protein